VLYVDLVVVLLIAAAAWYSSVAAYRVYAFVFALFTILDYTILHKLGEGWWHVIAACIFVVIAVFFHSRPWFKLSVAALVFLIVVKPVFYYSMVLAIEAYELGYVSYDTQLAWWGISSRLYDFRVEYFPVAWLVIVAAQILLILGGRNGTRADGNRNDPRRSIPSTTSDKYHRLFFHSPGGVSRVKKT